MPNAKERIGSEIPACRVGRFATIYADPPWRFDGCSGRGGPAYRERFRYNTLPDSSILAMPVERMARINAHLYLWVVNSRIDFGLRVMEAWGFRYRTQLVWGKVRRDGQVLRGMGNFFRSSHELCLFGTRGKAPTLKPGRTQPTVLHAQRREHSRKPDEFYEIIERCSPAPRLELFARYPRNGWYQWGNQLRDRLFTRRFGKIGDDEPLPTTLVFTRKDRHVVYRAPQDLSSEE
jgi:N6-adenosine-specific RNA methylase IME4